MALFTTVASRADHGQYASPLQLGLTSAHELETFSLEHELFTLTPTAGEPLSTFILRFSFLLAQRDLPELSDLANRKGFHRLSVARSDSSGKSCWAATALY